MRREAASHRADFLKIRALRKETLRLMIGSGLNAALEVSPCQPDLPPRCFVHAFASADPSANCDHSTTAPTLNVNDFQCFLNAFAAGCS